VAEAGATLLALLAATALSVYKPRGMTRYGRRQWHEQCDAGVAPGRSSSTGTPHWVWVFGAIVIVLVLLFVVHRLTGGGHGH
jgi:hypothetical protein